MILSRRFFVTLLCVGTISFLTWKNVTSPPPIHSSTPLFTKADNETTFSQPHPPLAALTKPLPGETILTDFANPTQSPAKDLTLLHRCLDTYLLTAKGMKDQPLSANGEIAAVLRGEGRVKVAFLPRTHPIFNAAGLLIDRWGTPFHFHAEQAGVLSIRSAGPDLTLWTDDDLHLQPNGIFLHGAALNPPSLLPAPGSQPPDGF